MEGCGAGGECGWRRGERFALDALDALEGDADYGKLVTFLGQISLQTFAQLL